MMSDYVLIVLMWATVVSCVTGILTCVMAGNAIYKYTEQSNIKYYVKAALCLLYIIINYMYMQLNPEQQTINSVSILFRAMHLSIFTIFTWDAVDRLISIQANAYKGQERRIKSV